MSSSTTKRTVTSIVGVAVVAIVALGITTPSTATYTATKQVGVNIETQRLYLDLNDGTNNGTANLDFKVKPGDVTSKTFEVTNTGDIPAILTIGSNFTDGTPPANVDYRLLSVGVGVVSGPVVGPLGSAAVTPVAALSPVTDLPASWNLGVVKPGQTKTVVFTVKLDKDAGNDWMGLKFGGKIPATLTQQ